MAPQRKLRVSAVADRLDVSRAHVERLIATGELPAVRVGKRSLRIAEEDLDAWLASRRTQPPPPEAVQAGLDALETGLGGRYPGSTFQRLAATSTAVGS